MPIVRQSFFSDKTDIFFAHYSFLVTGFEKLYSTESNLHIYFICFSHFHFFKNQNMNYMERP